MNVRVRGELIRAAVALSALIALSALATVFVRSERERNRLLVQYEAERIATGLLVIVAQAANSDTGESTTADLLLRAATYDGRGRLDAAFAGDVPAVLDVSALAPGEDRFFYNAQAKTVTLIRRGWRPGFAASRRGRGRRLPPPPPLRNELVLVEIDAAGYFRIERWLQIAQIASPLAIAAAIGAAAWLVGNNVRYRRDLDAQRQLVQLGEAARTLTHEIKNPLSAIRLKTGILRRTIGTADSAGELDVIDDEVRRLALLADRVSEFIRDPIGDPELLELTTFLTELTGRFEGVIFEPAGIQASATRVRFDRERLRSVVENLVRNATESGGTEPVVIRCGVRHRSIWVAVLDRGRGVQAAMSERAFDLFYTTKATGTGVGLTIARRFAEAAGGTITLSAREGGGTMAVLAVPAAPATRAANGNTPAGVAPGASSKS